MAIKILVVDDETDVTSLISQKYEDSIAGYDADFTFASNGKEALEILEKNPNFDLVLTDISMPVMDGLELLSQINKRWPMIKVIVVSAYNNMNNIRRAMNQGAFDFITKPIGFDDLETTIANGIKASKETRIKLHEKNDEHEKLIDIESQLDAARNIQSAFIPKDFNQFLDRSSYSVYGTMKPANEIGGDFFDFFLIDDNHVGLVIADVSGKGVPAALFMTMTRAALRCFSSFQLSECIEKTNEFLCHRNESCMFVTVFYGILNTSTGEFNYTNAGHNPPLIVSLDGSIQEIGRNQGVALGIKENLTFQENKIVLKGQDSLIYYTDGVTEAMNSKGEMFTEERLRTFLSTHAHLVPRELVNELTTNIKAFVGSAEQSDDITMFCLKSMK